MPRKLATSRPFGVLNSTTGFILTRSSLNPFAASWSPTFTSVFKFGSKRSLNFAFVRSLHTPDIIRSHIILSFRLPKPHFPTCVVIFVRKERHVSHFFWSLDIRHNIGGLSLFYPQKSLGNQSIVITFLSFYERKYVIYFGIFSGNVSVSELYSNTVMETYPTIPQRWTPPTWTYSPSLARSGQTTSRSLRDIWQTDRQTDCKPSTARTSFVMTSFFC